MQKTGQFHFAAKKKVPPAKNPQYRHHYTATIQYTTYFVPPWYNLPPIFVGNNLPPILYRLYFVTNNLPPIIYRPIFWRLFLCRHWKILMSLC